MIDIDGQLIEDNFGLTQRVMAGEPIGVFYGQKFLGVDPQTGDALYLGTNGKPTADYSSAARIVLGNSNPDLTGGFTNTFSYDGFDLSVFFNFVSGNDVYNTAGVYMSDGFSNFNFDNQTTNILNAWTKPGDITNVPRIGAFYGSLGNYNNSSFWLYNGAYIRLKNLTFSYHLPAEIVKMLHVTAARVYASATNLWISTKYPGDPEVSTETLPGGLGGGQDFYSIPQPRTITLGINLTF